MSTASKIEWTDHTFNPWWGCARVSPACRFCYADTTARRYGHQVWRRKGPRRTLSDATWKRPLAWNRDAERAGVPAKVFCASMADVFEDHPDVVEPRKRLWEVIEATPWLRWQLLTKRPENVAEMAPWDSAWPAHVWLGTSVENQRFADQRIPIMLSIPAKTRFLSCEPLLGPVDLAAWLIPWNRAVMHSRANPEHILGPYGDGFEHIDCDSCDFDSQHGGIDWIITGGESGPRARETDLEWVRSVIKQCRDAGSVPFVKQLGAVWARQNGADPKGGDWSRWPEDLRVREYPEVAA